MASSLLKKSDWRYYRLFLLTLSPALVAGILSVVLYVQLPDWPVGGRLALSVLLLLSGLSLSLLLAGKKLRELMRPLAVLARAMQKLGAGERHIRVHEVSDGEMGSLERGFNAMSARILTMNDRMQAEIAQATQEQEETLEALEIRNAELDIARKRALAASQVKSDFLTNMSHEIRTPLNGIVGFADLLSHTDIDTQQTEYVTTISRSANSLLTIIDDILDYASLDSGHLVLEREPFSLRQAIDSAVQLIVQPAHDKHLEVVSLVYQDVPDSMLGDQGRLVQMLGNLLSNAVKFTDQGEVVLRVMLEEERAEGITLGISVSDTGIGIAPSDQENLFQAFQRGARGQRIYSGTGLGLSLCQTLVKAMQGNIEVSSQLGEGSTFRATVKLGLPEGNPLHRPAKSLGGRVFLHEDHGLSRIAIANVLSNCGLQVDTLENVPEETTGEPSQGLYLLASNSAPDSIAETTRHIRRLSQNKTPVAAIVGSSDPKLMQSLRDAGAILVLSKPLTQTATCEVVSKKWQPAEYTVENNQPIAASGVPALDEQQPLLGLDVLAADDNPINLQLLRCYLENLGGHVTGAVNGQQAVDLCKTQAFALVVLDVHMPVMNGLDAARHIRALGPQGEMPLIALTADVAEQNSRDAMRAGFDLHLTKPVTEDELRHQILDLLNNEQRTHHRAQALESSTTNVTAQLPVRDKEQALRIAGGSASIANKLLGALIDELPDHITLVRTAAKAHDWKQLWDEAHRLHGSTAVCAVPALHETIGQLQAAAKLHAVDNLSSLCDQLEYETQRLIARDYSI